MSSREAYAPPPQSGQPAGAGGRSYDAAGGVGATMHYLCAECGVKVGINKGEPIRCKECGHRVLYKQRTRRMVQFEAR